MSKQDFEIWADWIFSGKVTVDGVELKSQLTNDQKYMIMQKYSACKDFSQEQKTKLIEKVMENDSSDKAIKAKQISELSTPTAEQKESLWKDISSLNSSESLMQRLIKIQAFFQRYQQLDPIEPYFDKYFEILP